MACGMTPELMEALMNMQKEKEKQDIEAEEEALKEVEKVNAAKRRAEAVSDLETEATYDWTRKYEKWDKWEDPEELAKKEQEARRKIEAAKQRTSCNHDHSAERKIMDMSMGEKLEQSEEFNRIGNSFFAEGQFKRAAHYYHRGLIYFEYMFPEEHEKEEEAKMNPLQLKLLLNSAAAFLKAREYEQVIQQCTEALKIDRDNPKAYFRRAQARRCRHEYDKAIQDIKEAVKHAPNDVNLRQEAELIRSMQQAYKFHSKQLGKSMFRFGQETKTVKASASIPSLIKETPAESCDALEPWKPNASGMKLMETLISNL